MKKLTILATLLSLTFLSYGQGFIAAIEDLHPSKDCKMELTDGTLIEGAMASAILMNGFLKTVNIKDSDGMKHKYKADQIKRLKVKAGSLAKIDMIAESTESVKNLLKTDFNEIIEREYIIYEQALLPKKKDKYRLLQLLNPGFDQRIKVYQDPNAKETAGVKVGGAKLVGGDDKSYLVVKDGAKSDQIKKNKYKKEFPILFGDCDLAKVMDNSKMKFKNFAAHVFVYDQICGEKE
jgi:hypothetical protein